MTNTPESPTAKPKQPFLPETAAELGVVWRWQWRRLMHAWKLYRVQVHLSRALRTVPHDHPAAMQVVEFWESYNAAREREANERR